MIDPEILRRLDAIERQLRRPIEIPDFVGASYSTNAGATIANATTTIVDYEDQDYDTHACVTTGAAWKFTAPVSGYYHVDACVMFDNTATWSAAEYAALLLVRNGTGYHYLDRRDGYASADIFMRVGGSSDAYLAAGEYLDVRVIQASGGNLAIYTTASYSWITIHKIN